MENKDMDSKDWLKELDILDSTKNIIPKSATVHQLISLQAENQKETIEKLVSLISKMIGDSGEEKEIKSSLTDIVMKNNAITKMIQARNNEATIKAKGSYFDPLRTPICVPPEAIKDGTKDEVSDSALKLLQTFKGDTEEESDNLKSFLRQAFDISVTNKLTEQATKAIIMRKLGSTARKIIDSFVDEFLNDPEKPSLNDIIIKLEDRFAATLSPELANAKLNMLKKTPTMTYSQLEGMIAELTSLASRAEVGDKKAYLLQRRTDVLKQAISESDRLLLARENQSRSINGLGDLNLSQGIDLLIKYHSEKLTFQQVNTVMNAPKYNEEDSLCAVKESSDDDEKEEDDSSDKDTEIDSDEIKQELYDGFLKYQERNKKRGKIQYNNTNMEKPGNVGKRGKPPKKFVTYKMVNVNPGCCLKCNSPSHKFSQEKSCIYGEFDLQTKACSSCKRGGHSESVCIMERKGTSEANKDTAEFVYIVE